MYATCLWCTRALGRNETIEAFPVGRRLAYDAAKGRLWVVCPSCGRWNLTPLDVRWEAIDACERLFRGTRLRASTEQVGLARIVPPKGDGLELVRIGAPLRPELAAWRYGRNFARRQTRGRVVGAAAAGAGIVAGSAAFAGSFAFYNGIASGLGATMALWFGMSAYGIAGAYVKERPHAVVARLRLAQTSIRLHTIRRWQLAGSSIVRDSDGQPALRLRLEDEHRLLTGNEAWRVAARLLPAVNEHGGRDDDVQAAVRRLDETGSPEALLRAATRNAVRWVPPRGAGGALPSEETSANRFALTALMPSVRLALEMALHEEQERRAMEGELRELERAWREAEEIAVIADGLALPSGVEARLKTLRGTGGRTRAADGAAATPTGEVALSNRNDGADHAG